MKKFILLIALSALFDSAPGNAGGVKEAEEGEAAATQVRSPVTQADEAYMQTDEGHMRAFARKKEEQEGAKQQFEKALGKTVFCMCFKEELLEQPKGRLGAGKTPEGDFQLTISTANEVHDLSAKAEEMKQQGIALGYFPSEEAATAAATKAAKQAAEAAIKAREEELARMVEGVPQAERGAAEQELIEELKGAGIPRAKEGVEKLKEALAAAPTRAPAAGNKDTAELIKKTTTTSKRKKNRA